MAYPAIEIDLQTKLAVIDGFVEVPGIAYNKRLREEDALSAIPEAEVSVITGRRYFVLPAFDRTEQYPEDWFALLRAASTVL